MPRMEIITNCSNKSKKDGLKFLLEEFRPIKNSIILIIGYIFYRSTASTDSNSGMKFSTLGLFALIEVFL